MNLNDVLDGINIIKKYYDDDNSFFSIGADHDVIYMYGTDQPIPEEDRERLYELGWIQESDEYDLDETWMANV